MGIFADGSYLGVRGLITGSGWQLLSQFIGCIVLMIWTLGLGYLLFYILRKTVGLRVPVSEENTGIDVYEHGITCYPGFNWPARTWRLKFTLLSHKSIST